MDIQNSEMLLDTKTNTNLSTTSKYEIIKAILIAISGFLLGGAQIFNVIAPFGVAITSTIPIIYLLPCVIGTILSTMLFVNSNGVGYVILSILFAGGFRVILQKLTDKANYSLDKPIIYALISISAMMIGVFLQAVLNINNNIILLGMQVVLSGCFAYFFAIAIDALLNHKISRFISHIQLVSIGILTIILICGACSFQLFKLNIGVILSVILIYVITNRFNLYGASVLSIVVSIALNLYSPTMLSFTAILIISSFISGLFSVSGKFLQIASFLVITSFSYLFLGATIDLTPRIIDIFFATSIYILLPNKLFSFLDDDIKKTSELTDTINDSNIKNDNINIDNDDYFKTQIEEIRVNYLNNETIEVQKDVCEKLLFASDTMQDLKENLTTISQKFLNIEYNTITSIPDAVSNIVCKNCSRNLSCWGKNYDTTIANFDPIIAKLKTSGNVDEISMPDYFLAKCCKLTRLIEAINDNYNAFLIRQNVKRQVCEARAMVFEQFSSISDLLCEIGADLENITGYDEVIATKVKSSFCDLEEEPIKISCIIDKYNRKRIEIYTDKIIQTTPEILSKAITISSGINFDIPDITIANEKTKLCFIEKPKFNIDFGVKQSCFKDNTLSGDTVETFSNSKGQSFFLLSDGMGKGTRAAIDSVMTCSIMSKLLKAGFGVESSIKLINSSLVVKSTDESLSTIDLAKVDLYSGEIEIIKAGATCSFIYSEGEVKRVNTQSLPIGILQKPEFDSFNSTLKDGDICLIVSDGVTNNEYESNSNLDDELEDSWIVNTLIALAIQSISGEEIADIICTLAKEKAKLHQDDITVVAIKVVTKI